MQRTRAPDRAGSARQTSRSRAATRSSGLPTRYAGERHAAGHGTRRSAQSTGQQSRPAGALDAVLYLAVALALAAGWNVRDEQYIVAETSIGYALGIVGGVLMLALFLYPVRKRIKRRRIGSIKVWFRMHIALGVIAPALIVLHANFGTGSINDNIALFSMLLVAGSGFVGRYFYARIHHGLYGPRASLADLRRDVTDGWAGHAATDVVRGLNERLFAAEQDVLEAPTSVLKRAIRPVHLALKTHRHSFVLNRSMRRSLKDAAAWSPALARHRRKLQRAASARIRSRLQSARKVAEFRLYESLFSLWHVFHYPLFLVLVVAAAIHVVAVHFY